ncbi:1,4-dihydroxy-6-naphthoate synthase [Paenibacillus motobuensis]|uniref:1,4-dihydroxy-6-naphthoate synthase n=1 Tax=Paenibacillus TaxID=44249 RepID=UPI00203B31C8|nr:MULTISPECIES: 1,4-dihydroxy-6-naphthoate synthase [Paenibacillus]MCM3042813.1 1,4-dihydroxy-6-naphthoate synthase [Paenibacillus lutimineralis]MCM3649917.1 1,4-dihydroxy-6-naphthoate synthase [Paenibacillus motobuensis]
MEEKFDLFTKIFVDSDVDKEMLLDTVLNIVMGTISGSSILTKQAEIFIFNNGDFDEDKRNQGNDGFLYYKYYLEIEPTEDADNRNYVSEISNLLTKLWNAEFIAIASCDFEDLLPRKGGYNFDER